MLSSQTKGWVGTGALKYVSNGGQQKATDKQHWARDSKNNPSVPGPRDVRENIFRLFRSSAIGKYNLNYKSVRRDGFLSRVFSRADRLIFT